MFYLFLITKDYLLSKINIKKHFLLGSPSSNKVYSGRNQGVFPPSHIPRPRPIWDGGQGQRQPTTTGIDISYRVSFGAIQIKEQKEDSQVSNFK